MLRGLVDSASEALLRGEWANANRNQVLPDVFVEFCSLFWQNSKNSLISRSLTYISSTISLSLIWTRSLETKTKWNSSSPLLWLPSPLAATHWLPRSNGPTTRWESSSSERETFAEALNLRTRTSATTAPPRTVHALSSSRRASPRLKLTTPSTPAARQPTRKHSTTFQIALQRRRQKCSASAQQLENFLFDCASENQNKIPLSWKSPKD